MENISKDEFKDIHIDLNPQHSPYLFRDRTSPSNNNMSPSPNMKKTVLLTLNRKSPFSKTRNEINMPSTPHKNFFEKNIESPSKFNFKRKLASKSFSFRKFVEIKSFQNDLESHQIEKKLKSTSITHLKRLKKMDPESLNINNKHYIDIVLPLINNGAKKLNPNKSVKAHPPILSKSYSEKMFFRKVSSIEGLGPINLKGLKIINDNLVPYYRTTGFIDKEKYQESTPEAAKEDPGKKNSLQNYRIRENVEKNFTESFNRPLAKRKESIKIASDIIKKTKVDDNFGEKLASSPPKKFINTDLDFSDVNKSNYTEADDEDLDMYMQRMTFKDHF